MFVIFFLMIFLVLLFNCQNFKKQKNADQESQVFKKPVKINQELPPLITAKSAGVYDFESLAPLYEKESFKKMPPASLTKIMTAIVVLENARLDDVVKISEKAALIDQKNSYVKVSFRPGEHVKAEDLLYALLLSSSNTAAVALAEHIKGNEKNFVEIMNEKAQKLGLLNTYFKNASGQDELGQYTSVHDIAVLFRYAFLNDKIREILEKKEYTFKTEEGRLIKLENSNLLLNKEQFGITEEKILGGKTGSTLGAGECLGVVAEKNQAKIIVVVLNSQNRFSEAALLIKWAFSNYQWK